MKLHKNSSIAALVLAGGALGWSIGHAVASQRSIAYSVQAVSVGQGALDGNTITLPPEGSPLFWMNFILPPDYKKNTAVNVIFYVQTAIVPCAARFVPTVFYRTRPGSAIVVSLDGVTSVGGDTVSFFEVGFIYKRIVRLRRGSTLPGQKAGDSFALQMTRFADHATDNCNTPVHVHGINILYDTSP